MSVVALEVLLLIKAQMPNRITKVQIKYINHHSTKPMLVAGFFSVVKFKNMNYENLKNEYGLKRHYNALDLNLIYLGGDKYELPENWGHKGIIIDLSATGTEQLQITKSIIFQIAHKIVKTDILHERLIEMEQKYNEVKEVYKKLESLTLNVINGTDSVFLYSLEKEIELMKWVLSF